MQLHLDAVGARRSILTGSTRGPEPVGGYFNVRTSRHFPLDVSLMLGVAALAVLALPVCAFMPTTTLVNVNSAGTASGNKAAYPIGISANGRFILFQSAATDLVVNGTTGVEDAFVRDLKTGTTTLASANRLGV